MGRRTVERALKAKASDPVWKGWRYEWAILKRRLSRLMRADAKREIRTGRTDA